MKTPKKHAFRFMRNMAGIVFFFCCIHMGGLVSGTCIFEEEPHWIKSSVNGNFYVLSPAMPWTEAEEWVQEWGGHLATIRNRTEELWIREFLGINEKFWIGYNVIGRTHNINNFYWVSGENSSYTNWKDIQPDNSDGTETVTAMNDEPNLPGNPIGADGWNDLNPGHSLRGVAEIVTNDELGLVLESSGEVSISGNKSHTIQGDLPKKGDLLRTADFIKTEMNSLLKAAFPAEQGSRNIEMHSESEVRVAEVSTSFKTTLEFFKGELRNFIDGLPEGYGYEVITPQAVIGVRGTEFVVKGDESSTKVIVVEGSVDVTTLDGTQSIVVYEDYTIDMTPEGLEEPYLTDGEPEQVPLSGVAMGVTLLLILFFLARRFVLSRMKTDI